MGAAQSRPARPVVDVDVVVDVDNTLSRLLPHEFISRMDLFCTSIETICNDYLKKNLDAIVYNALHAYIQKHFQSSKNDKDSMNIMKELVADVRDQLEGFITDVRELREIIGRMKIIAKHTGPASFLKKLSENPICRHILSEMGCTTMIVGGRITPFKEFFGQECWRNAKLSDFFARLRRYLVETFMKFEVVSASQIELEGQLLDLRMQILQDPDFGKEELSPVAMVIKGVLLDIKLEKLKALATPNVRGA